LQFGYEIIRLFNYGKDVIMKKSVLILALILAPFMVFGQSLGDTNHSGGIDIVDALLIAQAYVGLNPSNYFATEADTNCSGSVDIVDALLVAQLYVGLISNFPCEATPAPTAAGPISIACGSSQAVGSFQADQYYSGGTAYANTNTIDVSRITDNPPPAALFNNERYGALSYTIPGFTSGGTYAVSLYFAETYLTSSGGRVFNVSINGAAVLTNFDIYSSAGGQNIAVAQAFTTTADSSGQIVIQLTTVTENPKICGISIQSGTAPTQGPTAIPTATAIATATPTATPDGGSCSGTAGNVYLTFDDGPTGNTTTIVNNLKNAGACKATFFVIGQNMPGNSSAYKNAGFSVQNHTQTHPHMGSYSYQQVQNELQQCDTAIQNAGFPKSVAIRLPYLESSSTIQSVCSAMGIQIINVSIDTQDWNGASTQSIISAASGLSAGQNPLMHENQANTIGAVSTIVTNLKNKGLGFTQY
jgi:peptidoglycan/xylan/chitin deacetylase (PgdA/CDA1 family)